MDLTLLADLEREIEYATPTSVFYTDLFRVWHELLSRPAGDLSPGLSHTVESIQAAWSGRTWTAWFERPLLLASALHRLVLGDGTHRLAPFYATRGGSYQTSQHEQFRQAMLDTLDVDGPAFLAHLVSHSLQTNEIARGICWLLPASALRRRYGRPIVLVELGCSAGLNLLSDGHGWRILSGSQPLWEQHTKPALEIQVDPGPDVDTQRLREGLSALQGSVAWRVGCDLHVPNARDVSDRDMLRSLIWGDNPQRLARLEQALDLQSQHLDKGDLTLQAADAIDFVPRISRDIATKFGSDAMVIFYNTVVTCYFDSDAYARLKEAITAAFKGPLKGVPCHWIEHEPPRSQAGLSERARRFESFVRVHALNEQGELTATTVAGTEMHPRKLTLLGAPFWQATQP